MELTRVGVDVIITIGGQLQACCTLKLRKTKEMVVHAMHICLLPPDRDMVCVLMREQKRIEAADTAGN